VAGGVTAASFFGDGSQLTQHRHPSTRTARTGPQFTTRAGEAGT
jgi:hypothetical protein